MTFQAFDKCYYADCHKYVHHAECRFAECHDAMEMPVMNTLAYLIVVVGLGQSLITQTL